MKGRAGDSCCEVGEAHLLRGVTDTYVSGCGWAGAVVVARGGV